MKRNAPKPFSPDDLAQVRLAGVRVPPALAQGWSLRPRTVLLARSLQLYRYLDLSSVPASRRAAAVGAQVRAWAPFAETGCCVLWFAQGAGLFAWDARRIRELLAGSPGLTSWMSFVPDSAHIAAPPSDGVRLVRGIEGFEGQVWKDGHLEVSRAFLEQPSEVDWHNFLRGAGLAPASAAQAISSAPANTRWSAQPVARLASPDALVDRNTLLERWAIFGGSLLLMLATAVVARDYSDISRQSDVLNEELVRHEQAASSSRAARDRALAARQDVQALTAALTRPNALELQEFLLTHLPQAGTEIQDLSFDGKELRVVVKAPANLARESIVRDLEQGGVFSDVHEARDSPVGALALVMNVRPPMSAPEMAAKPAP